MVVVRRWSRLLAVAACFGALSCGNAERTPSERKPAQASVEEPVGQTSQALGTAPEAGCTGVNYNGHDYWFCTQLRNWSTARSKCEAQGYNLVRIEDKAENDFVRGRIGLDAWLGGTDATTEGTWKWTFGGSQFWTGNGAGSPFGGLFSKWSLLQPDNLTNQDCAKMSLLDGSWVDDGCNLAVRYVCESGTDECAADPQKVVAGTCGCGVPDVDTDGDGKLDCQDQCPNDPTKVEPGDCGCSNSPKPAGTACIDGLCTSNTMCNGAGVCGNPSTCTPPDSQCRYGVFRNTYYWVCDNDRPLADVRTRCRSARMELASVESAAEDTFLSTKIIEHTFLSGSDQTTEGTWVWDSTGVTFWSGGPTGAPAAGAYANWDLGQPNEGLLGDDCMFKASPLFGGKWSAHPCSFADAYACEAAPRLSATPTWSSSAPIGAGPLATGAVDPTGSVLTTTGTSVVSVSPSGATTIVLSYPDAHKFEIDPSGTRFGVYTATAFEVRTSSGALLTSIPRQRIGYADLVPGTDLVFLPEMSSDTGEDATVSYARFYNPSGLRSRFPAPRLRISRLTATHLVHADRTALARTTIDGVENWRTPVSLRTFEISKNGSSLIGVLKAQGSSKVVHVNLATGALTAPVTLDGPFWNVAIAKNGRFTVATTKRSAYLFDGATLARRVDLPTNWAVSVDVTDLGSVAVGAQDASHAAKILLFGPNGQLTSVVRPTTTDGYRPYLSFFSDGKKLLSNETGGMFAFDVGRAP